jgi:hypothetical protein
MTWTPTCSSRASTSLRSRSNAAAVTARVTSSAVAGARSTIGSTSSSRNTTISNRWVFTIRIAARTRKSALVRSVNSVNSTIIDRRVSRVASVVSANV